MEVDADPKKKKAKIGDNLKSHSIVFAKEHRLDSLRSRGYRSLMDSTHKTNYLGWYLYTVLVRDEFASGIPCAHVLTDGEDSQILTAGLRKIKQWCNRGRAESKQWTPRYFLTDDSAAEQLAVQNAFKGIYDGELDVKHLLCQVHSDRTLRKRVPVRATLALAKAYMKEKDPEYLDPWEKKERSIAIVKKGSFAVPPPSSAQASTSDIGKRASRLT